MLRVQRSFDDLALHVKKFRLTQHICPLYAFPVGFRRVSLHPANTGFSYFTIPRKLQAESLALPESLEAGAVGVAKDGKGVSVQAFHHPAIVTLHTGWVVIG